MEPIKVEHAAITVTLSEVPAKGSLKKFEDLPEHFIRFVSKQTGKIHAFVLEAEVKEDNKAEYAWPSIYSILIDGMVDAIHAHGAFGEEGPRANQVDRHLAVDAFGFMAGGAYEVRNDLYDQGTPTDQDIVRRWREVMSSRLMNKLCLHFAPNQGRAFANINEPPKEARAIFVTAQRELGGPTIQANVTMPMCVCVLVVLTNNNQPSEDRLLNYAVGKKLFDLELNGASLGVYMQNGNGVHESIEYMDPDVVKEAVSGALLRAVAEIKQFVS